MTYCCRACDVNWWPYMCEDGACPECGRGTVRRQEPGSIDADARYKAAMDKRREAERQQQVADAFEAYCWARDAQALIDEAEAILRDVA